MNEITVGIVGLFMLLLLFLTGIDLGFGMAIIGFLGFAIIRSFDAALIMIATDLFETLSSYGLTVVPLFIFMGQISFQAGIANKLYDMAHKFVGHIPGGLALATVLGTTMFKAVCGSSPATTATFASIAVPEMERYGYSRRLSTGTVASSGTLGVLIPPSVSLIVFGLITEQSIGRLFLAGFLPGLMIAFLFALIILVWCRLDPSLGPKSQKYKWRERAASLPEIIWPAVIFIVVIGGLMKGIFTPTEAGSIGTFAVLLFVVLKGDLSFKGYVDSIREALKTACMVFMLVVGSVIMGHFLAVTKIPMMTAEWVGNLPVNRYVIIGLIIIIYNIGGSFIDDFAFMMLATPVFFPAIMKLGFDPCWFGIVIMVTVMIGGIIPPVAMNVFIVKNITKVPFGVIYSGCYPFLIALILSVVLLCVFPQIATFLPSLSMK
jgi:tripartite ATP-independent transporter DctM subunit